MDYRGMYYKLFNSITDVIAQLQQVQAEVEQMAINANEWHINIEPDDASATPEQNNQTEDN